MLSTIALKSGALGRPAQRCLPLAWTAIRTSSTAQLFPEGLVRSSTGNKSSSDKTEWQKTMEDRMARWEVLNEIFYGKDRDQVNFPVIKQTEYTPPVRMKILPYSFWEFVYNKLGVSGGYVIPIGLVTLFISKEIIAVDHVYINVFGVIAYSWLLKKGTKYLGPLLEKFLEGTEYHNFIKPLEDAKAKIKTVTSEVETDLWRKEGQKYVFESMKENVDLQLEAEYRARQNEVYTKVKNRLDYQLDVDNANRRFEQENMVNWITQNVIKSITPAQEKETLANCIKTLRTLGQQQAAV